MPGNNGRERAIRCGQAELNGRRWRVALIEKDGSRRSRYFEGPSAEQDARAYVIEFRSQTKERSLGDTVTEYLDHLARYGGAKRRPLKANSLAYVRTKLEGILQLVDADERKARRGQRRPVTPRVTDRPLRSLTAKVADRLYRERVVATKSNGEVISADTHRSELMYAHAHSEWCIERGYRQDNPWAEVRPEGELSRGKAQLVIDEARAFARAAYSDPHPLKGIAAVAVLTLGTRSNEILERRVRDLDDGGRVLWIHRGKTAAAQRRLAVPPVLRAALLKLAEGQGPDARIFGTLADGTLLKYVHDLCGRLGINDVCTHGLRGTQLSLTVAVAQDVERASRAAGHADTGVTRSHYLAAGVEQSARARVMEEILLTTASEEQRQLELEEAEREMAAATAKLNALRSPESPKLGTAAKTSYLTGVSTLTN